jgi:hypothetical protein
MERKYAGGDCCGLHRRRAYNRDTAINQGLSSQENSSIFLCQPQQIAIFNAGPSWPVTWH